MPTKKIDTTAVETAEVMQPEELSVPQTDFETPEGGGSLPESTLLPQTDSQMRILQKIYLKTTSKREKILLPLRLRWNLRKNSQKSHGRPDEPENRGQSHLSLTRRAIRTRKMHLLTPNRGEGVRL